MIILMGLAGSGKSTQGQILAKARGGVWLSAGQVLRDTPNEEVHEVQKRGELVDDRLTIPLMAEAINQALVEGKEIVLDGYPRTVPQAEWIRDHVAEQVEAVVRIIVPKDELFRRLAARGRADDASRGAIEERFRIVEQNIYTVCETLTEKKIKILDVDGMGTMEEVAWRINDALVVAAETSAVEKSVEHCENMEHNRGRK